MTSLAQQPPRSRSLVAWVALVLLVGVGHVVPALHFLFVAHHLCAEHGELVDVPAESAEPPRAHPVDPGAASVSGGAAHSHEHCGCFAATRAAAALVPPPIRAQLLSATELASVRGEERAAHIHIALLRYAPKLAPPAELARASA